MNDAKLRDKCLKEVRLMQVNRNYEMSFSIHIMNNSQWRTDNYSKLIGKVLMIQIFDVLVIGRSKYHQVFR